MKQSRQALGSPRLFLSLVLLAAGSQSAIAQEASGTPGATLRASIVTELGAILRREYVLDEVGARMATRLASRLAAGAYDTVVGATEFAKALTDDLRGVYLDRHLAVLPPERYRAFRGAVSGDHGPEGHPSGPAPDVVARAMNRDGRTDVGFLKLPMFDGSPAGLAAIDTAMRRLAGVDAMIIDLRSNPGGDADAVTALSNYLFAAPTHLVSFIGPRDASGQRQRFERRTTPNELSPRFAEIPVYLLIDGDTFSAAESFAFGLQRTSRATLVGAATGGGGHMNAPFDLPGGFGASISVGRTFDPRTGEGWQSTGVVPAVGVESDHALYTAFSMIADEATRTAGLDKQRAGVYATLQEYAEAWYLGSKERMALVLDPAYSAMRFEEGGSATPFGAADLLAVTEEGAGLRTPRELRNREIAVFDVFGSTASARLMLRDTVLQMQLRLVEGAWRITGALVMPKPSHRGS